MESGTATRDTAWAMSEENVQALRDLLDVYDRGDKAAWRNLTDPDLETVPLPAWPEPGPFIGPDAAWHFYKQFEETLELTEAYELTEVIDAGNRVVACREAPMRGRASAAEVALKLWGVFTFSDGRLVRSQWFSGRSEALEAAEVSE
jgi:ketosteroid isomerase-like protein